MRIKVILGLIGLATLAGGIFLSELRNRKAREGAAATLVAGFERLSSRVSEALANNQSLLKSLSEPKNKQAACVLKGTDCRGQVQSGNRMSFPMLLMSPSGEPLSDPEDSHQGFTAQGSGCKAYPSPSCPFRVEAAWSATCPESGECVVRVVPIQARIESAPGIQLSKDLASTVRVEATEVKKALETGYLPPPAPPPGGGHEAAPPAESDAAGKPPRRADTAPLPTEAEKMRSEADKTGKDQPPRPQAKERGTHASSAKLAPEVLERAAENPKPVPPAPRTAEETARAQALEREDIETKARANPGMKTDTMPGAGIQQTTDSAKPRADQ
jgi:hypothetical protein